MNTDNKTDFELLTTPFEADMPAVPWTEYPRPQLKRDSYLCLNGAWQLSCRRGKNEEMLGTITVPFPPESKISGIGRNFAKNDTLIYQRTFSLTEEFLRDRVLLHFGAVDQEVYVFVNGKLAGHHTGGYWPFTLDVTTLLQLGDNVLTAEVTDPLDTDQPYGKQRRKRGGMWYTPTSGIWQTVWMESVPENYITGIKTDISDKAVTLHIQGGDPSKILTVTTPTARSSSLLRVTPSPLRPKTRACGRPKTPICIILLSPAVRIRFPPISPSAQWVLRKAATARLSPSTASPISSTGFWIKAILPTVSLCPPPPRASSRIFCVAKSLASICCASISKLSQIYSIIIAIFTV